MLPREKRLPRQAFEALSRVPHSRSAHFSATVQEHPAPRVGGCAAVVSKKVAPSSVARHRLKRRMLVAMEPWCGDARAIIVYARAGAPSLTYEALSHELSELLGTLTGTRA